MATFYVKKTGSDSNNCTQAQNPATPKLTIAGGNSCMTAGQADELVISAGTYAEGNIGYDGNGGFPLKSGQDASNRSLYRAAVGETVIIKPPDSSFARVIIFAPNEVEVVPHCQYIEFRDLEIDGSNVTSDTVKVTVSSATTQPHHIRFRNCNIHQGVAPHHAQGVLISDGNNIEIIGGQVHDNGTDGQDHQIYISHTSFNTVDGVEIYNGPSHGIQVWSDGLPSVQATNNTIKNNIAHDTDRGFGVYCGDGNLVYNNSAYSNVYGVFLRNDGGTLDAPGIYNNTIYSNSNTGILIQSVEGAALIKNNIVYLNSTNIDDQAGSTLVDNLTTNPFFVDAASHDFHLTSSSTGAIGQAVDLSAIFTTDQDGVIRTVPWDIGAFKYIASGSGGGGVWSGKIVFSGAVRLT